jgi:hypothetical protein
MTLRTELALILTCTVAMGKKKSWQVRSKVNLAKQRVSSTELKENLGARGLRGPRIALGGVILKTATPKGLDP